MQHRKVHRRANPAISGHIRAFYGLALALTLLSAMVWTPASLAQQQQQPADGRPRRAEPTGAQQQQAPRPAAPVQNSGPASDTSAPRLQTPAGGQQQQSPQAGQDQQPDEIDPEEVITIESDLINLNVRVVDRLNRPVDDVRKEEFRVFEDGVAQTIQFLTKEEVPIQYGLVIDNSGSLRHQINQVIEASKTIVNSNKPGDETFVVRFVDRDNIEVKQDFTADQRAIMDALDDLYIEGGATAIIDAVYLSAERVTQYKKGDRLNDKRRRALILVTDGEDRDSYYDDRQLFELLREADVQIYAIGFVNELEKDSGFIRKSKREKAVDLLNRLTKETGGRAFYPTSLRDLPEIAREITRDLRTQYVVSYSPTNKARDGSYRAVRVTVADSPNRDKRIAITRTGYTRERVGGGVSSSGASRPTSPARRP